MARTSKSKIPVLLYRYEGPARNIGFTFSPLYLNEDTSQVRQEDMLFIYDEDFEHIRPAISHIFPITDPWSGETVQAFDPCWNNPIAKEAWQTIVADFKQVNSADPDLQMFLDKLTVWIRKVLDHADGIEVTGNL
ncbi:hypothetical protein HUB98_09675 [Paenibacillus barcinonensis]|uniref:Uncharacterized protein n=1 Tax=Paenibacillus barcinonensis TaxID=198119 RepID=A0A2V4VA71_PAEBA|nr:hypothetical protein [Paenibacillus barcinonensis]PYE49721.1 hypothetical protein DFQ00_105225 [Paenibacillus barcinonensis]QKS56578.1 hypothetical protein HUB98_09675 [Paenibacillus barcinonensis]